MCGRYFLDTLPEEMLDHFSVTQVPPFDPSYNVAPTDVMPIVVEKDGIRRIGPARWGLIPYWAKDEKIGYKMINARAETIAARPAYREAWQRRRCLVPASGFFEWRKLAAGGKQPYAIRRADHGLIAFGGLWERWRRPDDEIVISYTIVTVPPNDKVAPLHDRMPLIIQPGRYGAWLTAAADDLSDDLVPCDPAALEVHPVSREVGSPRNNHPGLIEPA